MKAEQEKADREASADKNTPASPTDPDSDIMKRIRETLKMKRSALADKPTLPIYVPERLEQIMAGLRSFLEDQGFVVADVQAAYDNHDSILVVPISTDYLWAMRVIGKAIDVNVIMHSQNTLFF